MRVVRPPAFTHSREFGRQSENIDMDWCNITGRE